MGFTSYYGGNYAFYNSSGTWVGIEDAEIDFSTDPGYEAGDTAHFNSDTGELTFTDINGDNIDLRLCISLGNESLLNNWSYMSSWFHTIGLSFWEKGVGDWEWQDAGEEYVPGVQVMGENTRGYLHPQDYKVFADKYTKAEADAKFVGQKTNYSVTAPVGGWTLNENTELYENSVDVSGITDDGREHFARLDISDNDTAAVVAAKSDDWGLLVKISISPETVNFVAENIPASDLNAVILEI
jgi:hypothetical protein